MQRLPQILLVLLVIGLGAVAYVKRDELRSSIDRLLKRTPAATAQAPGEPSVDALPPLPRISKLPPPPESPGEKLYAKPGTFYMTKRAKVTTRDGVFAVSPGELVYLIERLPNNKLRVTVDRADFIVSKDQVTDDVETARAAEMAYLQSRGQQ